MAFRDLGALDDLVGVDRARARPRHHFLTKGVSAQPIADITRLHHIAGMLLWRAIVMIVFAAPLVGVATAQSAGESRENVPARLRGLSPAEAEALIGQLRDLQRRLRGGEAVFFELLSGAPAFYPMTTVSPRDAFLRLSFDDVESIERLQTGNTRSHGP